jgi:demethylmenaquinone methyltransferase/2-methoxy-6-polyprenyl-1,4-benzoquinol methylase
MGQVQNSTRPKTPQAVFDRVAPYYDTFNSLLSLGMDRRWRRQTALSLELRPGARVLDVATGTGALASEIVRTFSGTVSVVGCDLNERMLSVARTRKRAVGAPSAPEFVCCDATSLPFPDAGFDAATIAFAIDDMSDRLACVQEIARVLRPGGRLALLELGQPDAQPVKAIYQAYLRTFRMLGRGYGHLEQEILKYRGPDAIKDLLTEGGFLSYSRKSLTLGIARLHLAEKPILGSIQEQRNPTMNEIA